MALFKEAVNTMAYSKIGMMGFAGSGKTRTAWEIAKGLYSHIKSVKPIAFLDTETGLDFIIPLANKAGIKIIGSKTRAFKDLMEALKEAEQKCDILIIDSVTHYWYDIVESYKKKKNATRLTFQDWSILKPMWYEFTTNMLNSKLHVIVCGRAGFEYDYFEDEEGKKELYKTGTKMSAEKEFGFEPSLVIEMERIKNPETVEAFENAKGKTNRDRAIKELAKERKFVRRAWILKDRSDQIDGQHFDDPTFNDFKPHFEFINLGGVHEPIKSGDSQSLFNNDGKPEWKIEQDRCNILLEEIKSEYDKHVPGATADAKKAKIFIAERVFGTNSWTAIEKIDSQGLKIGLTRIKDIFTIPKNTLENLSQGTIVESKEVVNVSI